MDWKEGVRMLWGEALTAGVGLYGIFAAWEGGSFLFVAISAALVTTSLAFARYQYDMATAS